MFNPVPATCPICKNEFIKEYQSKIYCGTLCKNKATYQKQKIRQENGYFVCDTCGKRTIKDRAGQTTCRRKSCNEEGYENEKVEINCMRQNYRLRTLKPETIRCLRCGKKFESWDKILNRLCQDCGKISPE